MGLRIGIDVGGTNTDAVLLEGERVASWVKAPTTPDVQSGIGQALRSLVAESGADPSALEAVMLGTTQLVNALVQVKGLEPVGMIRVGLPSGAAIPPLYDWPEELRRTVGDTVVEIHGGYEYDGSSLADLRTSELDAVVARIRRPAEPRHRLGLLPDRGRRRGVRRRLPSRPARRCRDLPVLADRTDRAAGTRERDRDQRHARRAGRGRLR